MSIVHNVDSTVIFPVVAVTYFCNRKAGPYQPLLAAVQTFMDGRNGNEEEGIETKRKRNEIQKVVETKRGVETEKKRFTDKMARKRNHSI